MNEYRVWTPSWAVPIAVRADVVEMRSDGSLVFGVLVGDQPRAEPIQVFAAGGWRRWPACE